MAFYLSAPPVCKTHINEIILDSANVILKSPQINFENTLLVINVPFLCVLIYCFDWHTLSFPVLRRQRQEDLLELEVSLVYI